MQIDEHDINRTEKIYILDYKSFECQ